MRGFTYPIRRIWYRTLYPEQACRAKWCARPRLGISVWCREHTDDILEGRTMNQRLRRYTVTTTPKVTRRG